MVVLFIFSVLGKISAKLRELRGISKGLRLFERGKILKKS